MVAATSNNLDLTIDAERLLADFNSLNNHDKTSRAGQLQAAASTLATSKDPKAISLSRRILDALGRAGREEIIEALHQRLDEISMEIRKNPAAINTYRRELNEIRDMASDIGELYEIRDRASYMLSVARSSALGGLVRTAANTAAADIMVAAHSAQTGNLAVPETQKTA